MPGSRPHAFKRAAEVQYSDDNRGFLKGKSAVRVHREVEKLRGCLRGRSFWARVYNVSTVGYDEEQIRKYIQEQGKHQQDEGRLFE